MDTQVKNPQELFAQPQRFLVPLFQRRYVWSQEQQWGPLWQDIKRLVENLGAGEKGATHFLGAVVLQNQSVVLGSLPIWTIIDGQQRLTTIQILLGGR